MSIDVAFVATAAANLILASVALLQMSLSRRQVDDSTLPVVVPQEIEEPRAGEEGVHYSYRLLNDGKGPALNVEHGVELEGNRLSFGEEGSPYKFRTVREEESAPADQRGGEAESIDPLVVTAREGDPERVYWVRYETLHGKTYEARNSYDPASDLDLCRISRPKRLLDRVVAHSALLRRLLPAPRTPRWSGHQARCAPGELRDESA